MITIRPQAYIGNSRFVADAAVIGSNTGGSVTSGFGIAFGAAIRPANLCSKSRTLQIAKLELELFEAEQRQAFKVLKAEIEFSYFKLLTESDLLSATITVNESTVAILYLAEKRFISGDISLS